MAPFTVCGGASLLLAEIILARWALLIFYRLVHTAGTWLNWLRDSIRRLQLVKVYRGHTRATSIL